MKRNILFILLFFFFLSCKKNTPVPYYFQFQMGDSTYVFDSVSSAIDTSSAHIAITTVRAYNPRTGSNLQMSLQSTSTFVPNTYVNPSTAPPLILTFTINIVSGSNIYTYSLNTQPFSVIINLVDGNSMQGVFSGTVEEQVPAQSAAVTNGQFSVAISYF